MVPKLGDRKISLSLHYYIKSGICLGRCPDVKLLHVLNLSKELLKAVMMVSD